jgi:hypothetical protein
MNASKLRCASAQDIRVTSVEDGHGGTSEEFSACGAQFNLCQNRLAKLHSQKSSTSSHARDDRGRSSQAVCIIYKRRRGPTYVVTGEVVDVCLCKHGIVFEFGLSERRSIASDDNLE